MTDYAATATAPEDSSPYRKRRNIGALLFGVLAAPLAWSAQFVANYILAVDPCFLTRIVNTEPVSRGGSDWLAILIVNLVAALLAIVGGLVSLRIWWAPRYEYGASAAIYTQESRTRFLALWGVMTSFGFLAAILFDTIGVFLVPRCSG